MNINKVLVKILKDHAEILKIFNVKNTVFPIILKLNRKKNTQTAH